MKLKSFEKKRVTTATEYIVFKGKDLVDSFVVDYTAKTSDGVFDIANINKSIRLRTQYEMMGAEVRFIDVNRCTGRLQVTIEI